MNRYATWILGGLMGIATGALVAHPLAAMIGPTTVTWDASTCPAGVYTVTSYARSDRTPDDAAVTSSNVTLPRQVFTQQFDLPKGMYAVSAIARAANGQTFGSAVQSVTGLGASVSASGGISSLLPPHRRATTSPKLTRAEARAGRTQPATTPTTPAVDPPKDPPRSTTPAIALVAPERALPRLVQRVLAALEAGEATGNQAWRSLEAIDTDADGVIDTLRIDFASGDVVIWRFDRGISQSPQ